MIIKVYYQRVVYTHLYYKKIIQNKKKIFLTYTHKFK